MVLLATGEMMAIYLKPDSESPSSRERERGLASQLCVLPHGYVAHELAGLVNHELQHLVFLPGLLFGTWGTTGMRKWDRKPFRTWKPYTFSHLHSTT